MEAKTDRSRLLTMILVGAVVLVTLGIIGVFAFGAFQNATNSNSEEADFDATTLAEYNTTDNCYVAYEGEVYDVTNDPSWENCQHYGQRGGQDITEEFPHEESFLEELEVIGTYAE